MNYFVFGKINTNDYSLYVANKNQFDGGGKREEVITVPGKNGTVSISDGTFENIKLTYQMYGKGEIRQNIAGLRDALGATSGYMRLADSLEPDVFIKARYSEPFTVKSSDRKNAALDIEFDCDPRRFLKNGERVRTVTSGMTLKNPTNNTAKPLIRVYGTGTLTINSISVQITAANEYTDIDSEIEETYKGSTNCNNNIVLTNGLYPVLTPGNNTISFTGFTQVTIKPNWWIR